jgi:hypothetical protein
MDLLTPPPATHAAPAATTDTPTPAAATSSPAPEFNAALPENWFLAGGDAFAAEADTLGRFKSVTDLAKSYVHLRKHGPSFPTETSTPEDIERFRTLAQVPATPEAYGIAPPEQMPEGLHWDQDGLNNFAKIAHQHHVPAPAFKALVDAFTANEATKLQAVQAAQEQEFANVQKQLLTELGPNQLDFQRNAAKINHTVAVLAEKANIDPADPALAAIRSNPAMIRILHQVSLMTAEDPTRAPSGYGDLRSARDKADDIMKGRDPEWSEAYKRGEKAAVDRVAKLLSQK